MAGNTIRSFEDYIILKAQRAGIKGSKVDIRVTVNSITPYLLCRDIGHYRQPKYMLWRFASRPWRCQRCGTWWSTVEVGTIGGVFRHWSFLGDDGSVPKV